ncbi:hypothetical protein Patl1_27541 [Pistacia atlantica]|uniref:Uncharacterized protein n=1 Tax=Pistacia atlantica TaxID=434234 RepID=A0ACC1BE53_9ROSI|nr:hypothetical protein Patl1_27541 [Pistacia atlantica]
MIEPDVENWLHNVNSIINETDELLQKKADNSGCSCFNPSLITRYKHGKKAFKLMKDNISPLLQEKRDMGTEMSYPVILQETWATPEKGYTPFESRESTLKEIVKALNDFNVNMIGVHGMPGVGKTTLVKEVLRQVEKDKLFDKMIFIEVTQTVETRMILTKLGNKLGMQLTNKDISEMKMRLHAQLKNMEEKILIIFDNVWEVPDLETTGILEAVDEGKCKVLLTTRGRDVLKRMGCKVFEIGILSEEESWRLFKNTAGPGHDFIKASEVESLAKDICKKCGRLPIAIVTLAKALKNECDPRQWEEALQQLNKSSRSNFEGALKMAYLSIELSYNYLRGEELKKTFLLCSLMSHQASTLDLVKYVLALDIFERFNTVEEALNKVHTLINELKGSCLLLDNQTNTSFSMHDFVREVALSIANRDDHAFSVRNEFDWEWPSQDKLEICEKIFIHDSIISDQLGDELECPKLESFFMNNNNSYVEIPEKFFSGMRKLKVLDLTGFRFSSLSSSLHLLVNLQTLSLKYGTFEDVTIIGKLKKLKILILQSSNVKQLPREIGHLTKLKLLDLSYCRKLEFIAPNVISSLFRLEELYMRKCFALWKDKGENVEQSNASLHELNHLSRLTALEIDIKVENIFPLDLFSKEMKRYKISIEDQSSSHCTLCTDREHWKIKSFDELETFRTVKLEHNSIIWSGRLRCFKNVEFLCLGKLQGIKNVLTGLDEEGFSQLKVLHVRDNPNILVYC